MVKPTPEYKRAGYVVITSPIMFVVMLLAFFLYFPSLGWSVPLMNKIGWQLYGYDWDGKKH